MTPPPNGSQAAEDAGCRYPLHGDGEPARFCGEAVRLGSSYCAAHHARCYLRHGGAHEARAVLWIGILAANAHRIRRLS